VCLADDRSKLLTPSSPFSGFWIPSNSRIFLFFHHWILLLSDSSQRPLLIDSRFFFEVPSHWLLSFPPFRASPLLPPVYQALPLDNLLPCNEGGSYWGLLSFFFRDSSLRDPILGGGVPVSVPCFSSASDLPRSSIYRPSPKQPL